MGTRIVILPVFLIAVSSLSLFVNGAPNPEIHIEHAELHGIVISNYCECSGNSTNPSGPFVEIGNINGSISSIPAANGSHEYWKNSDYTWKNCTINEIPANAVRAGQDSDGKPIYAGRAYQDKWLLPANVVAHKGAYVSWSGSELAVSQFEVLCGPPVAWQFAKDGAVPPNAIPIVVSDNLYFGRIFHEGAIIPGKVQPSQGVMYIPFKGKEISKKEYEVMVYPYMPTH